MNNKKNNEKKPEGETLSKNAFILLIVIISFVALCIRLPFLEFITGDMNNSFLEWMAEISNKGGIKSLGEEIGDYNIIYMIILTLLTYIPLDNVILIKAVSIAFCTFSASFFSFSVSIFSSSFSSSFFWFIGSFLLYASMQACNSV